jgi:hypothetical protein
MTGGDVSFASRTAGELDGRAVLVAGHDDHTIALWDLETLTAISEPMAAHTDMIIAVAVGDIDGRAARVRLAPTVARLQASAFELLDHMCAPRMPR